jgi:creatinine amidohydrolase
MKHSQLAEEVRITHLHPREFRARRDACAVAWLPIGTIEWHGKHLPLGSDGILAEAICTLGAREIGGVAFPTMYYGDHRGIIVEAIAAPGAWGQLTFDHREECCGELGISVAGVAANAVRDQELLGAGTPHKHVELIERSLWMTRAYGFSRVVVLECHGGVIAAARAAIDQLNAQQTACRAIAGLALLFGDEPIGGHAGTFETSANMYFWPDLVRLERLDSDDPNEPTGVDGGHPRDASAQQFGTTAKGFIARCSEVLGDVPPMVRLSDPDEDAVPADWTDRVIRANHCGSPG